MEKETDLREYVRSGARMAIPDTQPLKHEDVYGISIVSGTIEIVTLGSGSTLSIAYTCFCPVCCGQM